MFYLNKMAPRGSLRRHDKKNKQLKGRSGKKAIVVLQPKGEGMRARRGLRTYYPVMEALASLGPERGASIIQHLDKHSIGHLCTAVYNLMHLVGHALSRNRQLRLKKALAGKENCMREICAPHSTAERRRLLVQSGSGLFTALATILPIALSILTGSTSTKK